MGGGERAAEAAQVRSQLRWVGDLERQPEADEVAGEVVEVVAAHREHGGVAVGAQHADRRRTRRATSSTGASIRTVAWKR